MNLKTLNRWRDRLGPFNFWAGLASSLLALAEFASRWLPGVPAMFDHPWIPYAAVAVLTVVLLLKEWQVRDQAAALSLSIKTNFDLQKLILTQTLTDLGHGMHQDPHEAEVMLARYFDRCGQLHKDDKGADEIIAEVHKMVKLAEAARKLGPPA